MRSGETTGAISSAAAARRGAVDEATNKIAIVHRPALKRQLVKTFQSGLPDARRRSLKRDLGPLFGWSERSRPPSRPQPRYNSPAVRRLGGPPGRGEKGEGNDRTKPQSAHIGIVGCSAEGAALCYRTVCASGAALLGPYGHPEVSLHTPSFSAYVDCLDRADWAGVADLMLASANKLARIGADFLVCPDNTIHQALPLVLPRSPLPWLPIADVVADQAVRRG